jgi:hypothetical protein
VGWNAAPGKWNKVYSFEVMEEFRVKGRGGSREQGAEGGQVEIGNWKFEIGAQGAVRR